VAGIALQTRQQYSRRGWLVEQPVPDEAIDIANALCDGRERRTKRRLQIVVVEPEVVERPRHGRVGIIQLPGIRPSIGDTVGMDCPLWHPIAIEFPAVEILMHIEKNVIPMLVEQPSKLCDPVNIGVIDGPSLRSDIFPDDVEPDRIESPRADSLNITLIELLVGADERCRLPFPCQPRGE